MNDEETIMEPITTIKVGTTAISVIKSISELGREDKYLAELKSISNLLDQVIQGQEDILRELRALRVEIREDLRSELISLLINEFYGYASAIETQIGRVPMSGRRAVHKELIQRDYLANLEKLCWRMEDYGLPAATAALSSSIYFIWYIGVLCDLGASPRGLRSLKASFLRGWDQRFFYHWITEGVPGSLPARIKSEQILQGGIKTQVEDHQRKIHLGFLQTGYVTCPRSVDYKVGHDHFLNITGNLESGFSGSVSIENRLHYESRDNSKPKHGDEEEIIACPDMSEFENMSRDDYELLHCREEVIYVFALTDGSDMANRGNQILRDLNSATRQFNESVQREIWLKWFFDWCVSARSVMLAG